MDALRIGTRLKIVVVVEEGGKASGGLVVPHTLGIDGRVKVGCGACLPCKDTEGRARGGAAEVRGAHRLSQIVLVKKRRYW